MEYCPVGVPMGKYSNNFEYQEIDGEVVRCLVNKVNQKG
jgi:hypothetical protein